MLVLAFMGIFLIILGTITSYALQQARYGRALLAREQAFNIAEAGLEYYRWFLAHFPDDLQNGTGQPGPYAYEVSDPEGGAIGSAELTITGSTQCGVVQWVDITARGTANASPGFPRTLYARYMRPSVAAYSYLLNSNVWAGADRTITGPYFSNGGIRMDGTNNSLVSSARTTWSCSSQFGCSPTQTKDGVWGAGSGSALWRYPVSSIDFGAITASLSSLKTYAQSGGGRYFAPASGTANRRGYHLIFRADGTFDVYRVTDTTATGSYSEDVTDLNRYSGSTFTGWTTVERSIIASQTFVGNYTIPSSCQLIFVEDRAWIEGVVSGKVTVVVATPSDGVSSTNPTNAFLVNNITYATNDGTSGLTVIAENSVLIPLNVPSTMELHGIFVAQGGLYGRNHYTTSGSYDVPESYNSYVLRTQLTTVGTVVSNLRTGTSWSSGGTVVSGFQNRIDSYDQLQATNPPPFTPSASTDYKFVLWREQ